MMMKYVLDLETKLVKYARRLIDWKLHIPNFNRAQYFCWSCDFR
jgi:hypothetical protein